MISDLERNILGQHRISPVLVIDEVGADKFDNCRRLKGGFNFKSVCFSNPFDLVLLLDVIFSYVHKKQKENKKRRIYEKYATEN